MWLSLGMYFAFFFSSRRRHTRCALVTGVQTCALPISHSPGGNIVPPDDPDKFRRENEGLFVDVGVNPGKAVHLMDIHAEKGMQCSDCHFSQDSHGTGFIYGEVANAIEIDCKACHGTAKDYPTLLTSGPARSKAHTTDLQSLMRNSN